MNANERELSSEASDVEAKAPTAEMKAHKATRQHRRVWLDALLVMLLFMGAFAVRIGHTRGDLWQDEAEYALASTHSISDQRWDRSDVATEPLRLVRLRHFHPPMTAYLLRAAQTWGRADRTLRTPFVIAGSLVVCLVYFCGVRLFEGRRDVSLLCALIVLFTPLQIRASSHAIPWSEISLGIMAVLWMMLQYLHTTQRGWLIGLGGVLGWLFCTTESFFPILLAVLLSLPFVLSLPVTLGRKSFRTNPADENPAYKMPVIRPAANRHTDEQPSDENILDADALSPRRRTLLSQPRNLLHGLLPHGRLLHRLPTIGVGGVVFFIVVLLLWPVGLFGGAWGNIQHYAHLPADTTSAVVGGVTRSPIPKWAFLYWFSHDYKPYFVLYAFGTGAILWQIAKRRLSRNAGVLAIITVVEITVAHLTVEFGPQYLAHCLPLLTLMTGFCFCALAQGVERAVGSRKLALRFDLEASQLVLIGIFAGLIGYLANWQVRPELRITDEEAKVSRWPDAAKFLVQRWQPGDRLIIGPQPVVVPRWYLLMGERLPIRETQIGELPQGRTRLPGLQRMEKGEVRFAVVNSTFDGNPNIDEDVRKLLATWPVVYRSHEPTAIPSRLVIYERPSSEP